LLKVTFFDFFFKLYSGVFFDRGQIANNGSVAQQTQFTPLQFINVIGNVPEQSIIDYPDVFFTFFR
jgi:hypothetical protein